MPDLQLRLHKDMLVVAPLLTHKLLDAHMNPQENLEYLNILDEELVRDTHLRFKAAGADCAPTNTLRAQRTNLQAYGLEDALVDINRAGVRLVRDAGITHILATVQLASTEEMIEQAEALLLEHPDAIMLAQAGEVHDLLTSIQALRALTDIPIIAPAQKSALDAIDSGTSTPTVADADGDAAPNGAVGGSEQGSAVLGDVIYTSGLSTEESLAALKQMAHDYSQALMICPEPEDIEGLNEWQRKQAVHRVADELVDFAVEARMLGAQFIGTSPGSIPAFTGAIFAAVGAAD